MVNNDEARALALKRKLQRVEELAFLREKKRLAKLEGKRRAKPKRIRQLSKVETFKLKEKIARQEKKRPDLFLTKKELRKSKLKKRILEKIKKKSKIKIRVSKKLFKGLKGKIGRKQRVATRGIKIKIPAPEKTRQEIFFKPISKKKEKKFSFK